MEIPTNSVIQSPNRKLIIAVGGVFVAVIILVFISTILSNRSKKEEVSTSANPTVSVTSAPQNIAISPTQIKMKNYKNSLYSIDHPADWQAEELIFPNGDTGTSIAPSVKISSSPSLLVVKSASSSASVVQQKQAYFTSIGFVSGVVLIDNIQAKRLRGSISGVQVNHFYLSRGGSDYLIKFTYLGTQVDSSLEEKFIEMISTFRFN